MKKSARAPREKTCVYDGIICIGGEDWWYHNRGHFDFQIMRRLAEEKPVLFVNSLAVRMPSLKDKALFLKRIARKLKSFKRGLVNVENNFWVYSPLSVPGKYGRLISQTTLAPQIRLAARRAGIRNPLLWMHCPAGAHLVDGLSPVATILQRTDRFEAFPEITDNSVADAIAYLKSSADLVVYCNEDLMREEEGEVNRACLLTHGVDYEHFVRAGDLDASPPPDMSHIEGPIVGFTGGIDYHTFDPELLLATAKRLPHCQFVLVGNCSLEENWCTLANVHLLGQKPYDQIARYMAACDTLIMPWNKSEWIKACNPIKLKEYLSTGRPVVTTDFPALAPYRHLVRVADGPDEFANAIADCLLWPPAPEAARASVCRESWDAKAHALELRIEEIEVGFSPRKSAKNGRIKYIELDECSETA